MISANNPGIGNWIDTVGHRRGFMKFRWQRTECAIGVDQGPRAEVVDLEQVPRVLPHFSDNTVTDDQWKSRIAARQVAVANRMLG